MGFDREFIEAKIGLDLISSEDMPTVAQDALEAGLDGHAIVRLAILEKPTYFQVAEVLPLAMAEMGLKKMTVGQAACVLARRWAKEILNDGKDPLLYRKQFEWLWIKSDYAREIQSVGTLDDEVWIAESTGQTQAQIRGWVTERLRALSG